MSEHGDGDGDGDAEASVSATFRPSYALGRGLPGRISLNPPPPGRLTSLRSRDLTLGGYKKVSPSNVNGSISNAFHFCVHVFALAGNWSGSTLSDCDPTLVTKCIKKEKKNTEDDDDDEILQKLQRDDFLDDPGLKNDPKQRPIRLPFYQSCNFLSTDAFLFHIFAVKEETASDKALKSARAEQTYPVPGRGTPACPQQPTLGELFQQLTVSDKEELLFIQLPDTIPGQPKTSSPEKTRKDAAVPMLSDFSEGLIGKLQIRKSGKVQLVMGNVTLDVSEGAAFSFLQVS
uniref:DNA-directed RNA polymerase III subunit RPC4-like n=1 Tax=Sinocyclocheilus grahami TaxID=75366 RepID=A0A672K1P2_SINGR